MTRSPTDRSSPQVTVIGVGNRYRRDDAAGLEVVRRVRERMGSRVRVLEVEGEPLDLLDAWDDADVAIVADAVVGSGAAGTIHTLDAGSDAIPIPFRGRGTHTFSIAEVVELARATERLPNRLVIYGIEGDEFSTGEGLTAAVGEAVETAAAAIEQRVRGS